MYVLVVPAQHFFCIQKTSYNGLYNRLHFSLEKFDFNRIFANFFIWYNIGICDAKNEQKNQTNHSNSRHFFQRLKIDNCYVLTSMINY